MEKQEVIQKLVDRLTALKDNQYLPIVQFSQELGISAPTLRKYLQELQSEYDFKYIHRIGASKAKKINTDDFNSTHIEPKTYLRLATEGLDSMIPKLDDCENKISNFKLELSKSDDFNINNIEKELTKKLQLLYLQKEDDELYKTLENCSDIAKLKNVVTIQKNMIKDLVRDKEILHELYIQDTQKLQLALNRQNTQSDYSVTINEFLYKKLKNDLTPNDMEEFINEIIFQFLKDCK